MVNTDYIIRICMINDWRRMTYRRWVHSPSSSSSWVTIYLFIFAFSEYISSIQFVVSVYTIIIWTTIHIVVLMCYGDFGLCIVVSSSTLILSDMGHINCAALLVFRTYCWDSYHHHSTVDVFSSILIQSLIIQNDTNQSLFSKPLV